MSLDLKVSTDEVVRIGDREFHNLGAETEKARDPIVVRVLGRNKAKDVDDRVEME